MSDIHTHTYDNGLTLLIEPMQGVGSAAMTLLIPAGAMYEPADRLGVGEVLGEMIFRGAGEFDAKQHCDALDRLGLHRSSEITSTHLRLGATMLGDQFDEAMPLLLDMVRRPHLADKAFGPSRTLAVQAIEGLDDEPQRRVMIELKRRHHGEPRGRSVMGRIDDLKAMTADDVRGHFARRVVPTGAIMGVAGNVDVNHVVERIGELLGDWSGDADESVDVHPGERGYAHMDQDTQQAHIGVAYDAVPEPDADSMTERLGVAVLSGGMSGRLFIEVREERGLCYAVYATYAPTRDHGTVYAYAGTTTQRAAETLEVMTAELNKLGDGVDESEFDRAVVGLKSRLIMQGESTAARAAAIASDQYPVGRPRTLEQRAAEVDAVTLEKLNDFVAANRPTAFTTVTIGPHALATV